jgi:KDO2-lipid IV(A) lauroyltransferase
MSAKPRTALRNWAEYLAVRAFVLPLKLLPRAAVPAAAAAAGRLLAFFLARRREVVRDNVRRAYGDDPAAPDPDRLFLASLTSLCRSFLELFLLPPAGRGEVLRAMLRLDGWTADGLRARCGPGPVVFAASHFGAYEMCGAASSLWDFPLVAMMRPLDNPLLDVFLNEHRSRFGQRLVGNRGGLGEALRALGEGRSVAVLVDLNMPKAGALFPRFFGAPAATAKTAALLAVRAGRPLVPVFCRRDAGAFRFAVEIAEPIFPDPAADRDADCLRLLQAATDALETRVRERPDQWLWTHRRWKTRPPSERNPT